MKPLFKNTTTYNSENYNKFVKFHEKKFSFSYNAYNIIMLILILYCIISTIKDKNILLCLCFLAMLIAFVLIRIYFPIRRTQKTQTEFSQNKKEDSFTFSFYKHYFVVATNRFYYIRLHKIFETEEYYYLYLDEENAFLVSKTGFEIGTAEEFSKFIKKKCIFKYSKQA